MSRHGNLVAEITKMAITCFNPISHGLKSNLFHMGGGHMAPCLKPTEIMQEG